MIDESELLVRVHAVAARQDGVLAGVQAAELGVPEALIRRIVRRGRWLPLARGSYWVVPQGQPRLRTQVRAALFSCGSRSVAVGPTAARLHGLQGVPRRDRTVHVGCPAPGKSRSGIAVHRLCRRQTTWLRGLPVTTVAQTVADVLRTQDRMTAVSVADSALHQRLVPGGIAALDELLRGQPRVETARRLLGEVDERAESPLETRNRLVCTDAGMPPETLQWPLADTTGARYRVDLGWPSKGVGVEADGSAVHDSPEALYRDRHRQNALLAAYPGLILLRFTWRGSLEPERFLGSLRQALMRR